MLGVFAEFERGMIRERVNAGLARARAKGTKLGRRPVKPSIEVRIRELKATVCTENLIRVDEVKESPKLTE